MRQFTKATAFIAGCALAGASSAGDWTRWRGPDRNGISAEKVEWSAGAPKELWRIPLGEGFSGIAVADGRVYTMHSADGSEYAVCLNADTGDEIWKRRTDRTWDDRRGSGPRSMPTVAGDAVYVVTGHGKVYSLHADTGDVRWMRDMVTEFGGRVPNWGYSCSVLVEGDAAYFEAGGTDGRAFVALNRATGDVLWTTRSDEPAYSSPMLYEIAGKRQVVFFSGESLVGVEPSDGTVLWSHQWVNPSRINIATPALVGDDKLLIASAYDTGAALIQIVRDGDGFKPNQLWMTRSLKSRMATPVLHDGYLYGFDGDELKCLDAETAEEKWKQKGFGEGSVLLADGKLVVLGANGILAVAPADPSGYREIVRAKTLDGNNNWTIPTLANGRMYLRDHQQIVCIAARD